VGYFGIVVRHSNRSTPMRWETPRAIDMRFGMEITLYIARR
jgi:coenzyme PQQ precursor peptide PqqA